MLKASLFAQVCDKKTHTKKNKQTKNTHTKKTPTKLLQSVFLQISDELTLFEFLLIFYRKLQINIDMTVAMRCECKYPL